MCRGHCGEGLTFNRLREPSESQRGRKGKDYIISTSYLSKFMEAEQAFLHSNQGIHPPARGLEHVARREIIAWT